LIFGLAKPSSGAKRTSPVAASKGALAVPVEVIGWRVFNQCTGEVMWSEPASRTAAAINKAARRPPPQEPKPGSLEPAAPADKRPARLGRYDIEQTLAGTKPRVRECYERYEISGRADLVLEVEGTGAVQAAAIKGPFEDTPTARCLLEALGGVKFP